MAAIPSNMDVTVVDSPSTLLPLLATLASLPSSAKPSLYIDQEGIQLSRHGSISIISLLILPRKKFYLIDILKLGSTAFSLTAPASGSPSSSTNSVSLKSILESPNTPKVVFDIRNDSDALFSHFGIRVDGIHDLQLMELATRKGSKRHVSGLAKCVEKDIKPSRLPASAKATWFGEKALGNQLFNPAKGGRYEVFNERPIRPTIMQYCVCDVMLLPLLYDIYSAKLGPPGPTFWQVQVEQTTKARIRESQSPGYDPFSDRKDLGPWGDQEAIEEAIDAWNEDIMMEAMNNDFLDDFDFDYLDDIRENNYV